MRVVVLASGRGSNLKALVGASQQHDSQVNIAGVVSDRLNTPAVAFAQSQNLQTDVVDFAAFSDRQAWDHALAKRVEELRPDLVVLAGFMRLVGPEFLRCHANKVINTHPSLLPAFPGRNAPEQAVRAKVRISGCTVHLVDHGMDTGPIIAQAVVPVLPSDQPESLHARIQKAEHRLLCQVVEWLAHKKISLDPTVHLDDIPIDINAQFYSPPLSDYPTA